MLIDLHTHSKGISRCCRVDTPTMLARAKEVGLDGIVLTNHYQKSYIEDGDVPGFITQYMDEFYSVREAAKAYGIQVFFGIEVTMELYPKVHMLVYGLGEAFLRRHPKMYDYSQQELYTAVHEAGGVLVQAHPYRGGTEVLDTALLDGLEINCHPLYKESRADDLIAIAEAKRLKLTCGSDYHGDTYRAQCGTYFPDTVQSSEDVGEYLKASVACQLLIHEPNTDTPYKLTMVI